MTKLVSIGYPETAAARDEWIRSRRPARRALAASRPYSLFVEDERAATGEVVSVATVFLTNRECPWRCLMCDLWQNTLTEEVPAGTIPAQIEFALEQLPTARQIKLYNSGSFFDPRAIPVSDHAHIVELVSGFERVIVESHPALVGKACFRFRDLLDKRRSGMRLEVAMGLETAHPLVLEKLNKRMTLEQFARAAGKLQQHDIDLRVFILVKPPFMEEDEALDWACRSLDFAFDRGATAVTLIPTRAGNGALEELAKTGGFSLPRLATVEAALHYGLSLAHGRVFVDLWHEEQRGVSKTLACPDCRERRIERLRAMNLCQTIMEQVSCATCGAKS
jgi:radical SAM enzyme (TIGR01210 family)